MKKRLILIGAALLSLAAILNSAEEASTQKIINHTINSPYLGGVETTIQILLPARIEPDKRYRVLYILPVRDGEISGKAAWGQPMRIAQEQGFADKYHVICVMATFPRGSLYVNHPTKQDFQDESYFVKDVVPFVDEHYPTLAEPRGRLLVGFCASGNGAMWTMLRHLDMFGKAAAWDTWADLDHLHPPDTHLMGTEENFQKYCLLNLVDQHAKELKNGPTRIVMMSYRNNRDGFFSVNRFQEKLFDYGIPYVFEFHTKEKHRWDSGWLPRAVAYLFSEDIPK